MKGVFIAHEVSRGYSNEPCIVRRLSRRPSKLLNFSEKGTLRRDGHAAIDMCCGLINVYQIHHQPSVASGETYQKIEDSMKPINGTRCMKSGLNEGVRSVSVDQSVA
jgi:hypothetical protein